MIFFFPYTPPLPATPPNPPPVPRRKAWFRSISDPFGSVSAPFGSVWLLFASVSGPFQVRFGVLGGVGEMGFCKGKEPRGPREASWCREAKIAARQFLPLNCRAITLTTGAILKEEKMSSSVGERQFGRHFMRQFGRGELRVKNCREASRCLAGPSGNITTLGASGPSLDCAWIWSIDGEMWKGPPLSWVAKLQGNETMMQLN